MGIGEGVGGYREMALSCIFLLFPFLEYLFNRCCYIHETYMYVKVHKPNPHRHPILTYFWQNYVPFLFRKKTQTKLTWPRISFSLWTSMCIEFAWGLSQFSSVLLLFCTIFLPLIYLENTKNVLTVKLIIAWALNFRYSFCILFKMSELLAVVLSTIW